MADPLHFIAFMGIPASGKSTLAREHASTGVYTVIDADQIRLNEFADDSDKAFEEYCMRCYEALVRGENVILDAPNPTPTRRAMLGLIELAENLNKVPVYRELIVMRIPTQVSMDRNKARGQHAVTDDMMQRHYIWFEKGLTEIGTEGWDSCQFVYSAEGSK